MANQLMLNEEAMSTAQKQYADQAVRMKTLRDTLKTAVDDIRSGWQSNGGTEFFNKFDDEWYKNFNDYIAVIEHMSENMTNSNNKYQEVYTAANKIKLHK